MVSSVRIISRKSEKLETVPRHSRTQGFTVRESTRIASRKPFLISPVVLAQSQMLRHR